MMKKVFCVMFHDSNGNFRYRHYLSLYGALIHVSNLLLDWGEKTFTELAYGEQYTDQPELQAEVRDWIRRIVLTLDSLHGKDAEDITEDIAEDIEELYADWVEFVADVLQSDRDFSLEIFQVSRAPRFRTEALQFLRQRVHIKPKIDQETLDHLTQSERDRVTEEEDIAKEQGDILWDSEPPSYDPDYDEDDEENNQSDILD